MRGALCFVTHDGYVGRIRVGQLFHFCNGCFGSAGKLACRNLRRHVRVYTDPLRQKRHVPALYVGRLLLGFRTHTGFLVHNGIADSIEKLILRPCKFRVGVLFNHLLIGIIVIQIRVRGIRGAVFLSKHIRQRAVAPGIAEAGEFFVNVHLVIRLGLGHVQIAR